MFSLRIASLLVSLVTFGLMAHATPVSTDLAVRDSCNSCSNAQNVLSLVTDLQANIHVNLNAMDSISSTGGDCRPYLTKIKTDIEICTKALLLLKADTTGVVTSEHQVIASAAADIIISICISLGKVSKSNWLLLISYMSSLDLCLKSFVLALGFCFKGLIVLVGKCILNTSLLLKVNFVLTLSACGLA